VEDSDIVAFADQSFRKRGINILTNTTVTAVTPTATGVSAVLSTGSSQQTVEADRIILAVGISGNIHNLGLEQLGVTTARGFITTDVWCKTNVVGLYAIGDVAGPPWLAHKASHEAVLCVEKIAGVAHVQPLQKDRIPGCTYCRPQIASVGMSEQAARAAGRDFTVGRFNLSGNGKALAIDEAAGFVKTLFDNHTGELLGAHMIGPEVTEQIQGFVIAKQLEATSAELAHTVFAHPTLSESMHEAVLDSLGIALHQ
jgi:dihydrolipoamide dehydrogenase